MKSILFLGDVFLPKPFDFKVALLPDEEIIFNLEYPITRAQLGYPGKVNLKAEQNYIEETFSRLPLAVSLSNNHVMDYGSQGLDDTFASLKEKGIRFFGAGRLEDNCHNPLIFESNGCRLGVLGYVCPTVYPVFVSDNRSGVMPDDFGTICQDINATRQLGAERIVVVLHWGFEDVFLPRPQDIELAHRIIDNGADLIIGHHAHCIQPYEVYKGKHIFYGLGNCIMPDLNVPSYFTPEGKSTLVYTKRQKWWHRPSLGVRYTPCTGAVELVNLRFDGDVLIETKKSSKSYQLKSPSNQFYQQLFQWEYFKSGIRKMVANFMMEPKLPRKRHLALIISHIGKVFFSRKKKNA